MSRPQRMTLIERDAALSCKRQCGLVGISRASLYLRAQGQRPEHEHRMRLRRAIPQHTLL
jgi:hypothetical protein